MTGECLILHVNAEVKQHAPVAETAEHTQYLLPVGFRHQHHRAPLRNTVIHVPPAARPALLPLSIHRHGNLQQKGIKSVYNCVLCVQKVFFCYCGT